MRRLMLACALHLTAAVAHANPSVELRTGENAYIYGAYEQVIAHLRPLVEPDLVLADAGEIVRAYEKLGLAYFFLGRTDDARQTFRRLVLFRPEHTLDPVLVPPPAVALFDEIRAELSDEIAARQEVLRRQREEEARKRERENERIVRLEYRRNSRWVAAAPFGAGQFQNGDVTLGTAFLATEIIAVGLSAGFFLKVEDMRQEDGRFPGHSIERARDYQTAQLVSGGIALGLMLAGIVHAQVTYRENVETDRRVIQPNGPSPPLGDGLLEFRF